MIESKDEEAVRKAMRRFHKVESVGLSWLDRLCSWVFLFIFKKDHGKLPYGRRASSWPKHGVNSIMDCTGTIGLFHFIEKRERWSLTLIGWFVVLILSVGMPLFLLPEMHGFLAMQDKVNEDILVVESWIPDFAIPGAVDEFKTIGYRQLILVGTPIMYGGYLSGFKNHAEFTHARMVTLGIDTNKVTVLEIADVKKDRTYQSALAVKKWISSNQYNKRKINVYTLDTHSRRSRLLFQKAMGDDYVIGVISAPDIRYDAMEWWKSSNGFRSVADEFIAYVYAAAFFHP